MNHKMISPIVITVIVVAYYAIYFVLLMKLLEQPWKILMGIIPISLAAVMIYVCIQRIGEIRSGEEDDLSQY